MSLSLSLSHTHTHAGLARPASGRARPTSAPVLRGGEAQIRRNLEHTIFDSRLRTGPLQGYLAHSKYPLLGPYSRTMPIALRWSWGGGRFLMSKIPLWYHPRSSAEGREAGRASAVQRVSGTKHPRQYRGTSLIRKRTPVGVSRS